MVWCKSQRTAIAHITTIPTITIHRPLVLAQILELGMGSTVLDKLTLPRVLVGTYLSVLEHGIQELVTTMHTTLQIKPLDVLDPTTETVTNTILAVLDTQKVCSAYLGVHQHKTLATHTTTLAMFRHQASRDLIHHAKHVIHSMLECFSQLLTQYRLSLNGHLAR